jgi:thioredoxin-related protein
MKFVKIAAILLLIGTIGFAQKKGAASEKIVWKSFDAGMSEAKKTGKKVLIDVYTDWCGWCKKMDAGTYSDKKVVDYLQKNFVTIKLNPEKDGTVMYDGKKYSAAEFSQGMGVNGYPATLFLKSNGQPITLLPGYSEADMFLHVISFIGEDHYEKKKFADYLAEKGVKQ